MNYRHQQYYINKVLTRWHDPGLKHKDACKKFTVTEKDALNTIYLNEREDEAYYYSREMRPIII